MSDDRFHTFSVRGGPLAHSLKPSIDGQELRDVTGFTIEADVSGTVRVRLDRISKIEVMVESVIEEGKTLSKVKVIDTTKGTWVFDPNQVIAEAVADTAWEALLDCSRQLELAAKAGTT